MLSRSIYDAGLRADTFIVLAQDTIFWRVIGGTAQISLVVTVACLVLGFPVAYALSRLREGTANLLMILVLLPFWTSILVRTYAWMSLFGRRGLVNDALIGLGLVERPLQILNTRVAVLIAMTHVLLPFMILPLYTTLRRLDWRLVQAAQGLGATPRAAFRQVVLPLAKPGIIAGCVLVFTLSIGFYITPVLVGGSGDMMIAVLIENFVRRLDWRQAAAMSLVLIVAVALVFVALGRLMQLGRLVPGDR